ncbi:MAG: hypothetical protein UH963_02780 [Agathobacter sp.]|nr:hypothetical protein [Agathobacter sp.]
MNKKTKYTLTGASALVIAGLVTYAFVGNGNNGSKDNSAVSQISVTETPASSNPEISTSEYHLVSLDKARKDALNVVRDGKEGKFNNFIFKDFTPAITDSETIYEVNDIFDNSNSTVEWLEDRFDVLYTFMGKDIDKDKIDTETGLRYDDLQEVIKNNDTKTDVGFMLCYQDDDSDLYAQIVDGFIWIDTGMEGVSPNLDDCDKVYYHNETDSLTDTYETNYGKVSIKEAIEKTEKYFNEEFPLDSIHNQSVFMVCPYKNSSGKYEFAMSITDNYDNIPVEAYMKSVVSGIAESAYFKLSMANYNGKEVNFFNSLGKAHTWEETKKIDKIIPVTEAMEIIASNIGKNTEYTLESIELCYTGIKENYTKKYKPTWIFYAVNNTDSKSTRFYVDAQTGEYRYHISE